MLVGLRDSNGKHGVVFVVMAENSFEELQRDLEQTLAKLKAATEPEQRRFYLREMSRLLVDGRGRLFVSGFE